MSEKIVGWIAVAVILAVVGWIYRHNPLGWSALQVAVAAIIGLGVFLRIMALRQARRTVVRRRRMYKEFWRRAEAGPPALDLAEEESIVLLGRIKGGKANGVFLVASAIGALYFGQAMLALVLALGQIFLAAKLYLIARNLDTVLPPDSMKDLPDVALPECHSDAYLVDIDLDAVHDFIRPAAAIPFWSLDDAERWLAQCGFRRTADKWEASGSALRLLDGDEIKSIECDSSQ